MQFNNKKITPLQAKTFPHYQAEKKTRFLRQMFFVSLLLLLAVSFMPLSMLHAQDNIRYEFSDSSRAIMRVGPNQTMDMLIQQIYPRYEELWPRIKDEIIKRNPHAINRYTGGLIQGERLKLVTVRKIHEGTASYLQQAGKVSLLKGSARVINKNGTERPLTQDALIFEGDRLNTYGDTFLVVNMIDGAQMRIQENSAIKISEYKMKSGFEKGSISVIDLIKGGLRKITGSIASSPFGVYRFQTGVMTIGVRGTDFVVKLCNGLDCSQSANRNDNGTKLHVVVLDGLITLQDEEGVQGELIMGQYAVATADTKIIVDDVKPVNGMLLEEERDIFNQFPDEPVEKENKGIWPWLIGGALLGIGL